MVHIVGRAASSPRCDPPLLKGQDQGPGYAQSWNHETTKLLKSGDEILITTEDPETCSLPSWDLLDMQWLLNRLQQSVEPQMLNMTIRAVKTMIAVVTTSFQRRGEDLILFLQQSDRRSNRRTCLHPVPSSLCPSPHGHQKTVLTSLDAADQGTGSDIYASQLSKIEFIEHPLCPSCQVEPAVRQGRPPLRDWLWVDLFLDTRAVYYILVNIS